MMEIEQTVQSRMNGTPMTNRIFDQMKRKQSKIRFCFLSWSSIAYDYWIAVKDLRLYVMHANYNNEHIIIDDCTPGLGQAVRIADEQFESDASRLLNNYISQKATEDQQ